MIHQARKDAGRINPSPTPNVIASLLKASEAISKSSVEQASRPSTENQKFLSRKEVLKQIRLARQRLAAITPSYQMEERWQKKKGEKDERTKGTDY